MGFSTLEISEILAITQRGVEKHRYRIKKKLKLKNDLIIFLRYLLSSYKASFVILILFVN
tara:strand:+ start:571 stop:750 length:180 start_codon:yes stop_codon:yes gene_type:complete